MDSRAEAGAADPVADAAAADDGVALDVAVVQVGTKTPRSTSQAPLLNSEKTVSMRKGWSLFFLWFFWVSITMMPVTGSWSGTRVVLPGASALQRMTTVVQVCQRLRILNGLITSLICDRNPTL